MIHNWCHFASLCGLLLLQVSQQQQQGLHLRAVSLSPVPPKLVIDRLYASTANEDPVRIPEHESQLPLVLALEVEEWCSIDDISEECVPLTDLTLFLRDVREFSDQATAEDKKRYCRNL